MVCMWLRTHSAVSSRTKIHVPASLKHIRHLSSGMKATSPTMASRKRVLADDVGEEVASTAVPGKQSIQHFPPGEKPNACTLILSYLSVRV